MWSNRNLPGRSVLTPYAAIKISLVIDMSSVAAADCFIKSLYAYPRAETNAREARHPHSSRRTDANWETGSP
jgi:hypothetical protein